MNLLRKKIDVYSNHPLHQFNSESNFVPIIYNSNYDVSFYKLEQAHPFDCKKWGKVAKHIVEYFESHGMNFKLISPLKAVSDEELQLVHSRKFIKKMTNSSIAVAMACEVAIVAFIPIAITRRKLLNSFRWQTAGTILAGFLALKHGWSINIGGGFHHCSAEKAQGFCLFADISLMIKYLWTYVNSNLKIMIVDLDAHQGNGHENDANAMIPHERENIYIFDMFNDSIYPNDMNARKGINKAVQIQIGMQDQDYLKLLKENLQPSLDAFNPHLIIYNAGSDILEGDPLGLLQVSAQGIIERDEYMFKTSISRGICIAMLTSGGYQKNNAKIIADSIQNLLVKQIIEVHEH